MMMEFVQECLSGHLEAIAQSVANQIVLVIVTRLLLTEALFQEQMIE